MIFNVTGGGAGSGGTLVVTAPAGVTCTVSKDGKTKSKTVDQYGYATFKGLDTGTWTVTISNGSDTATATVEIVADYAKTMTFFSATIAVTYPEGSTCTCSDGETTLTAPDTSGSCTFTVPNAGTWTVSCTDGNDTDSVAVEITANGESKSVELVYGALYYKGNEYTSKTGGWKYAVNADGSTIKKNADNIAFDLSGVNAKQTICTLYPEKKIDLTGADTLAVNEDFLASITASVSVNLAVWENVPTSYDAAQKTVAAAKSTSNNVNATVDVSSLSGSYYVGISWSFQGSSSYKCSGSITEIMMI